MGHNQALRVGQFSMQILGQFWMQINSRANWGEKHLRWLADEVRLPNPAQQVVFQEYVNTVTEAACRMERLVAEIHHHVKTWRLYPVVQALM